MARVVGGALLLLVTAGVAAGVFVELYGSRRDPALVGVDTPYYVWRGRVVADEGVEALVSGRVKPQLTKSRAYRIGYPVVAGYMRSLTHVDAYQLAFGVPAIMAAVVALGAGAFAVAVLREPLWAFAVYGIVVGGSANVAVTSVGYADTLVVAALATAAAATAVLAAGGGAGILVSILLLAGAVLVHWSFALLFGAVLAGLAAVLLPESFRAWRAGQHLLATPTGRMATLLAGSALAGVGALALAPESPVAPGGRRKAFLKRLARDVPAYRFAFLGPAAGVGVGGLSLWRDRMRRRGLALALLWALMGAGAVALLPFFDVAAHRVLGFSLGIPLLAAAGLAALARLMTGIRPAMVGRALAAVFLTGALVGSMFLASEGWNDRVRTPTDRIQLAEIRTASDYAAEIGGDRSIVFVANKVGPRSDLRVILSVLPTDQMRRTFVYLGTAENLIDRRPTLRDDKRYDRRSLRHWRGVRRALARDSIVFGLSSLNRGALPPGDPLAPGVTVIEGPAPPISRNLSPPRQAPSSAGLAAMVTGALLLFTGVGLGWSAGLLSIGWIGRLALAPAVGLAVLVLGGVAAGRLGLDGPGARLWIAAAAAALGWAPVLARRLRTGAGRHRD